MYYWHYDYGFFKLEYISSDLGLKNIYFVDEFKSRDEIFSPSHFIKIHEFIKSYVHGSAKYTEIDLDFNPTNFQAKVYDATKHIPFGSYLCYQDIAKIIKNPNSARAIGKALSQNPYPILIPCHRVIGKNKSLTGFTALGGIDLKLKLLNHENIIL